MSLYLGAFSIGFAAFAVDLWLHGPVPVPLNHAGLGFSLVAAAMARTEGFLIAELVWVVLLVWTLATELSLGTTEAPAKDLSDAAASPKKASSGPPDLPSEGKRLLDDALKKLEGNLQEKQNCDGLPWKVTSEKDGVKVYCSDFPGQSIKRWKVDVTIKGDSLDAILAELFDFDKRVGPSGWDTAIKEGSTLFEFKGDRYKISRMVTNAAAGGSVSSREFIDLRALVPSEELKGFPTGGVIMCNTSVDYKRDKSWLPKIKGPDKSLVTGKSFPGGGVAVIPVKGEPNTFKYTLVTSMALRGWVPVSVINTATGDALVESHQAMLQHLAKKFT
mmetsp:Transcript_2509/g.4143  ORF Transcript_2509/g.4143 Transcript_2509/m.4143 type:complete len:332 (+) Transcript_2509:6-1001(+)